MSKYKQVIKFARKYISIAKETYGTKEDLAFVMHLASNPKDEVSFLAYSDWLQEQGRDMEAMLITLDREIYDLNEMIIAPGNPFNLNIGELLAVKLALTSHHWRQDKWPNDFKVKDLVRRLAPTSPKEVFVSYQNASQIRFSSAIFRRGVLTEVLTYLPHAACYDSKEALRRSGNFLPNVLAAIHDRSGFAIQIPLRIPLWRGWPAVFNCWFDYTDSYCHLDVMSVDRAWLTVMRNLAPSFRTFLVDELTNSHSDLVCDLFSLNREVSGEILDWSTMDTVTYYMRIALSRMWLDIAKFFLDSTSGDSYSLYHFDSEIYRRYKSQK